MHTFSNQVNDASEGRSIVPIIQVMEPRLHPALQLGQGHRESTVFIFQSTFPLIISHLDEE